MNFTGMLSYAYLSDSIFITLQFLLKWAAKIFGPLNWATSWKRLWNTGLICVKYFVVVGPWFLYSSVYVYFRSKGEEVLE